MSLATDGYAILEGVISLDEVDRMIQQIEGDIGAGDRNALAWPWVRELARDPRITGLVPPGSRPVRAILFDKTPGANWNLGFHQDRAIPLKEKRETEGFTGWSEKDGVIHAIAPAHILENMTAVRLSLDDCGLENGPLRVLPGSHLHGLLDRDASARIQESTEEVACTVRAGGVVLMKSLLLHASSAATKPGHRRVLHIEFYSGVLPEGLEFHDWSVLPI